jgi:D-alanine-D-alanine ligase
MHVALTFNQRGESTCCSDKLGSPSDDLYAEWDDPETIQAIASALASRYQISLVNADLDAFEKLRQLRPDLVFNIAEGLIGANREGQIPAILEMLDIPYTGSDSVTLGNCLNKMRTKEILSFNGIPSAKFGVASIPSKIPTDLAFPLLVKPIFEGSSKGVPDRALVNNYAELQRQVEWVFVTYQQPALVEEFLPGREFTVALLGNGDTLETLPIVEIDFATLPDGVNPIYSYEAKWIWDTEDDPLQIFSCPAQLDSKLQKSIEDLCRQAFRVMGCRDWCRIDVRLDAAGVPHIIELNPLPGLLPRPEQNSCLPKAARAASISYQDLVLRVVDEAVLRLNLVPEAQNENLHLL